MAEVLVRREPSTAMPITVLNATGACPPVSRRARNDARPVDWEKGTLLDVLIDNRPMLVNLARGFVGCASLAEDVVHDVFIKLVDFPNQGEVRQPVAYVTRMVRNASIDAFRRQSLENTYHADEDDGSHVPSPEPSPEAALLARDTLRHVYNALEQLPRAQPRRLRDGAPARGNAAKHGARPRTSRRRSCISWCATPRSIAPIASTPAIAAWPVQRSVAAVRAGGKKARASNVN